METSNYAQRSQLGGPPVKAGFAMFFKIIALLMAAISGYFVFESDFDFEQAYIFLLLPGAAIAGYLLLGSAD
jgi:hypothetical protein